MTGEQLNANAEQYLQANGMNAIPPLITSDPLVTGSVPIEQLLRVLGLAANLGDPQDNSDSLEEHAKRDVKTSEAAAKFPAQDENAASELKTVAAQGDPAQMAQQIPQMASGIAGALAGALGGALQPLAQIPQQLAQGAQQAMQAGMGMMQQSGVAAEVNKASLSGLPLDEFGSDTGDLSAMGGGGGDGDAGSGGGEVGGLGDTTPTAMLGPPPIPSAGTYPSSAPVVSIPPPRTPPPSSPAPAGMAGMPMVPPGAMHGAASSEKDPRPETKRVSVPTVKNGAPVQGRITVPPPAPQVTKIVDGKPVATKRIIVPSSKPSSDEPGNQPTQS